MLNPTALMATSLGFTSATSFPRIQLETTRTGTREWTSRVVARVGAATVRNWTLVDIWKKSNHKFGKLNSQASVVASNSNNAFSLNTDTTQITSGFLFAKQFWISQLRIVLWLRNEGPKGLELVHTLRKSKWNTNFYADEWKFLPVSSENFLVDKTKN